MWLISTLLPAECSRTSNTGINGYQTKTYGYEGATGFKTVGFRSNAPAGPCSEKKLPKADIAFNLYQGTGYLSIVKKWPKSKLDEAFNIYFMSAKYGLIHSSEWIEPYDQLLNQERLTKFASDKYLRNRARRHIRMMNTGAPLYLIVPKMYQNAFYALAGTTAHRFEIVQASGGIFNQRRQLKNLLADEIELVAKRNRIECAAFRTFTSGTPLKELWHLVRVGDWLRPWVSGAGASANFAEPIQVAGLRCSISGSIHAEDVTGHIWNDYQISAGIKQHGVYCRRDHPT